jgi:predicted nucleic acid-binding protein
MKKKTIRVYADTSVFGGVNDEEFRVASRRFFNLVREGKFEIVVSTVVIEELNKAPAATRRLYDDIWGMTERVPITAQALNLRDAYLRAGIIGPRWAADALHVAIATVSGCSLVVSWNFKHIVNFRKIPLYNAINRANGYGEIGIYTPQEVIEDEEENF